MDFFTQTMIWALVMFNVICCIGVAQTILTVERRGFPKFLLELLQCNHRYYLKIKQLWYTKNNVSLFLGLLPSNSLIVFTIVLILATTVEMWWLVMPYLAVIITGYIVNYEALKLYDVLKKKSGPDGIDDKHIGILHS